MSERSLVARHVHDLIERQRLDDLPDQILLRQAVTGDDAAFAAVVRRHGPLVLGTCRRILRHAQDAEDACQAVFLILARKGGTVRGQTALAGWLHRVAVRAALRLRRQRAPQTVEQLPAEVPAPANSDELVWKEIRGAFDAEVGRLPDRLRLPLVLCYLQGKTRSQAAAELGWTEGTVRGRLERGRKLLRSRFTRKGLTLPAALLPLLVEQAAPATSPPAAVAPSSVAARLADGLVRSMALARAKLVGWATAAVLLVGTAVGVGLHQPAGAQPKGGGAPPPLAEASARAKDVEKNLDTFVLRISLAPAGEGKTDPKFSLYHVLLYVPNLRLEPPANGPDGKPTEAYARITKDEAKKILDALWNMGFFDGGTLPAAGGSGQGNGFGSRTPLGLGGHTGFGAGGRPMTPGKFDRSAPHSLVTLRYQGGEDPTQRELVCPWGADMLKLLDGIRACVTGDGAKALDQLLAQLGDERKKWAPDPLAEDLRKIQGAWAVDLSNERLQTGPSTGLTAKCAIDGKSITFKPQVQRSPLVDLVTITGTFELSAGPPRRMTIQGVRDTLAKREPGTWTALYEVTGDTLKLLLPPAGGTPPATLEPNPDKGDRLYVLKRQAPVTASEWGESSNGVQARIRTAKTRYSDGEVPTFDLDVRDTHAGVAGLDWQWLAPRDGRLARVEVDGVWYVNSVGSLLKVGSDQLGLGQTVDKWTSVGLTDEWWAGANGPGRGLPMRLRLAPGKHKVRVGYNFSSSLAGAAAATPVSGPLEIEVVATEGKPVGTTSPWGEPAGGLRLRIHSGVDQLGAFGGPAIAVDVKHEADTGKPNPPAVRAGRSWHESRLEVDGIWYRARDRTREYLPQFEVRAGEEIKDWVVLPLHAAWVEDRVENKEPPPLLQLTPGKHTVRVSYMFWKDLTAGASVSPVSGPVEIVVPAAVPQVGANESKWGGASDGLRARIRTANPAYAASEVIAIDYDVKAAAEPAGKRWSAGNVGHYARVEVDGVWHIYKYTTYERFVSHDLRAGQEVKPWTTVRLDGNWVVEKSDPPRDLVLKPGKHTLRVEYAFQSDAAKPPTARPVSGPLEIEITAEVPKPVGWRADKAWKPFAGAAVLDLAAPDGKHLFTVGKDGLTLWDLTGKEPKAEQKVSYTTSGLTFAGLDRDGLPLLVRRTTHALPMGPLQADLSVLRLPDMNDDLKGQFAVMADSLRSWAVRPDGKVIAVLLTGWNDVRVVNINTGMDRILEAPKEGAERFAFPHGLLWSRDGKRLVGLGSDDYPVTGKKNGLVVCWDAETGKVLWQVQEPEGQSIGAVTRDGRLFVTGWRLGKVVTVWDLATGKKVRELPCNGAEAVAVSPDGKTVAVGTHVEPPGREPVLEIWDLDDKAGPRVPVAATTRSITFRDDGRAFATADQDGEVRWWLRD